MGKWLEHIHHIDVCVQSFSQSGAECKQGLRGTGEIDRDQESLHGRLRERRLAPIRHEQNIAGGRLDDLSRHRSQAHFRRTVPAHPEREDLRSDLPCLLHNAIPRRPGLTDETARLWLSGCDELAKRLESMRRLPALVGDWELLRDCRAGMPCRENMKQANVSPQGPCQPMAIR